jgi:hypothetical protein
MKHKAFDCVEMQHRGAEAIHEKLKGLTREQQRAFWKRKTAALRRLQRAVKARRA